ncbi:tetratricopeptide repeat protein [Gordonia amicalis]|uniref:tetratricopeptide repeat protein n=1 Tax=Gordonia amicalis TaxID=89053 RepID=UPI0012F708BA|nr:hypothetical protein [Gordonia amicalis]MBA5848778.1 hypothetical protein [Gordonia amicalis]MDV7174883.1 hypothetical protein [Gordonia amicalis]NKX79983.1 hypothetical protein [Gordonia amicalis]
MSPNRATETQIRSAIGELKKHYATTTSKGSHYRTSFATNLESLPPVRATRARELQSQHPSIERVVFEVAQAQNRRQAIEDWAQTHPNWLSESEAPVLAWFADLAADYTATATASLMVYAVEAGATPADYWLIRAALLDCGDTDQDQRAAISQFLGRHPLADAVAAYLRQDLNAAHQHLERWLPIDIGESAFKAAVEYQFACAAEDQEAMRSIATASHEKFGSTTPLLDHTKARLGRAARRESAVQFSDLQECLDLAIMIRDERRRWFGESAEALSLAVDAANLLGDHEFALKLTQPAPDGDAIPEEASDASILASAAMSAAHILDSNEVDIYRSRLSHDDPVGHQVDALTAQRGGDTESAAESWRRAYELSRDANDKLNIAYQLALVGHMPTSLPVVSPEVSAQLQLIDSAARGIYGQVQTLIAQARSNRLLAIAASELLYRQGRAEDAAKLAIQVGEKLNDPYLLMAAGSYFAHVSKIEDAVAAARTAIQVAPQRWGRRVEAWAFLVELLVQSGRWAEAADSAAQYLAHVPSSPDAQWALVVCQAQLGDISAAFDTYSVAGSPRPRTEFEAIVWVELWRHGKHSVKTSIAEFKVLLDDWKDNERVLEAASRALLFSDRNPAANDHYDVETLLADLIQKLPNVFHRHAIDSNDPLATLATIVSDLPDTTEIDSKIASGEFPLGVASTVFRRPYTQLLASRGGPVYTEIESHCPTMPKPWHGSTIVVDVSALNTLSLLPDLADVLLGYADPSLQGVSAQARDAAQAVRELEMQSTMTVGRSPDGTPRVLTITESEAQARHLRARRIQQLYAKLQVVDHLRVRHLPEISSKDGDYVWLTATDRAFVIDASLWCDDAWVRRFAESRGVATFSTRQLVADAVDNHIVLPELAEIAEAQLLCTGHVPAVVLPARLEDAARLTGWRPTELAHVIAYAPHHSDPVRLVGFAVKAMTESHNDPESLAGWTYAVAFWLIRVSGSATDCSQNLVALLSRIIRERWLNPSTLPHVLSGIRAAAIASGRDVEDPLAAVLSAHYQFLARRTNHKLAADHVRALVALGAPTDRMTALSVILRTN